LPRYPKRLPRGKGLIKVLMSINLEKRAIPAKLGLPVVKYKVLITHEEYIA